MTGDETWGFHHTPESKQQSLQWRHTHSPQNQIILAGKMLDDDDEVQEEVMTCFKEQAADVYDSGIQNLVPRLGKCLDNAGDYVEK